MIDVISLPKFSKRLTVFGLSLCILLAPALTIHAQEQAEGVSQQAQQALNRLESEDVFERQVAFLKLESLRERAVLPVLRIYLSHSDESTRAYALRAVAAIEGFESVPMLKAAYETDRHPDVRRAAIMGLEPHYEADNSILDVAIRAMTDSDTSVRMTAVDAVSRMESPQAREALRERLKNESRLDVLRVLKMARERLGGF